MEAISLGWSRSASSFAIYTVLSSSDLLGFSEASEEKCNCGGGKEAAQRQSTRILPGRS